MASKIIANVFMFIFVVIISIVVFAMVFSLSNGCCDESGATKLLQSTGFTQVRITGFRPFMGGEGDFYSTGFEAISPNGTKVTGAVTGGLFKGNTIRYD